MDRNLRFFWLVIIIIIIFCLDVFFFLSSSFFTQFLFFFFFQQEHFNEHIRVSDKSREENRTEKLLVSKSKFYANDTFFRLDFLQNVVKKCLFFFVFATF